MNFVIKFIEEQYLEAFLNGVIHFKANRHFIDLEKESNIKGIGDQYEGNYIEHIGPNSGHKFEIKVNGEFVPINFDTATASYGYENIGDIPITCFSILKESDFVKVSSDIYKISDETLKELKVDFIDRKFVFFLSFEEFTNRIINKLKQEGIPYKTNSVEYFDVKTPLSKEEFDNEPIKGLFYKRSFYKYQREYRIALKIWGKEYFELNIGDIRDIVQSYNINLLDALLIKRNDNSQ